MIRERKKWKGKEEAKDRGGRIERGRGGGKGVEGLN